MSKALQVTITMRPYPESKPTEQGWVLCMEKGSETPSECWYEPLEEGGNTAWMAWTDANDAPVTVTHFCLPSDITTTDAVRGEAVAWAKSDLSDKSQGAWPTVLLDSAKRELLEHKDGQFAYLAEGYDFPLGVLPFDGVEVGLLDYFGNLASESGVDLAKEGMVEVWVDCDKILAARAAALSHLPPATPRKGEGR